jgi:GT2 family glycosyltransferase
VNRPAAEVAVVIVNFNTGAWLTRCLDSLAPFHDDGQNEVLVIDNVSHHGSARRAAAAHPWARGDRRPTGSS